MKIDTSKIDYNKLFFTADPHFYHTNIIKYCDRPFDNALEMNYDLIEKWNNIVPKDGHIFVLGDFSMGAKFIDIKAVFDQLNGTKYLVIGNHDRPNVTKGTLGSMWKFVSDIIEITVADEEIDDGYQKIILCHYPMITWNGSHRGSWQLFGHVHGGLSNKGIIKHSPNQMDVGVDTNNFIPYSYEEIKIKITKQNLEKNE